LNIQTKIVKTQIEIVVDKKVITQGLKIEGSQVALLEKLKIRPFSYKMNVKKVYEDGAIFSAEVLDITAADIKNKFQNAILNMAAISLASGYLTKPAMPHLLANAFKNLAAVTFDSDYSFKQADKMKEASKNASAAVGKSAPAGGKQAAAAVVEEEVKEEADVDMGNMFGDEY